MVTLAALAVLVGWAGAALGRSARTVHVAGCVIAGAIIPCALIMSAGATDLATAVASVSSDIRDGVSDMFRSWPVGATPARALLVHGVVMWSVAQFAAVTLFIRRGAGPAVGAPLVIAIGSIAMGDGQVGAPLALTSLGALLVLVEHHALESRTTWRRRRLGDGSVSARRHRQSGVPYAVVAVVGATVMAAVLRVDLLGDLRRDATGLRDLMSMVGGMLPFQPVAPGDDGTFDAPAVGLGDLWRPGDGVAFQATIVDGLEAPWRATTFDRFVGDGWSQSPARSVELAAGASLLGAGDLERTAATGMTVTVRPDRYRDATLVSPGVAVSVDVPATLSILDTTAMVERVRRAPSDTGYTVTVAGRSLVELGVTRQQLRDAGRAYPAEVVAAYTQLDAASLGPDALALRDTILATSAGTDPFDIAVAFERFLSTDKRFAYATDLRSLGCDLGPVDCFARTGRGFCLQYATTMAVLLRSLDEPIPTRLVMGFLPGTRSDGTETVELSAKHAWVEVYFPGTGWVAFDPTGRGASATETLPVGVPASSAPRPSQSPEATPKPSPTRGEPTDEQRSGDLQPISPILPLLVALGAVLALGTTVTYRTRRGRSPVIDTPDAAWRAIVATARRFGHGPTPAQTDLEYAAWLGAFVPGTRQDLETIADARDEEAYGRRVVGADRRAQVRAAGGRVRPLLRRLRPRRLLRRR